MTLHLPPIYPITDATRPEPLAEQIRRLGQAGFPLVQFRGKPLDPAQQWLQLREALLASATGGGWPLIVVNDRADLAVLAAGEGLCPWGLHLGQEDLPPGEARRLPGLGAVHLGTSTHETGEWMGVDPACDHAGVGPFRATATKGDHARPIGIEGLREGCGRLRALGLAPVAIGGLGPEDLESCFQAGAESLAMVGAVARTGNPTELLWKAQCARWRARAPLIPGQGLVLLGGSGCGKSQLAELLAPKLGLPLRCLDREIALRAGRSIPELFAEQGEVAFRRLEGELLQEALRTPCLIDGGGGLWEAPENRRLVQQSAFATLWIAERPEIAWSRVQADPTRPLAQDPVSFMARWRQRMALWSTEPCVLPLGRKATDLAAALLRPSEPAQA